MNNLNYSAADEEEIRACIQNWAEAVRNKDATQLMRDYAPDVLVCDMMPPLQYIGSEHYRRNCEHWFQSWSSAIACEVRVERLHLSDHLALANCLTNVRGTMTNGHETDMWMRVTVGFAKGEGGWKVIHEHVSVPLDMQTGQPRFDLQP